MFTEETVFIIGAGASWHYGYPTGEGLIDLVIARANHLSEWWAAPGHYEQLKGTAKIPNYFDSQNLLQSRDNFIEECKNLSSRLRQVHPLVIDYFLQQNPKLQNIGKLLIAHVILECEKEYKKLGGNRNRRELLKQSPDRKTRETWQDLDVGRCKDNWYRFVIDKLISNCKSPNDLWQNKVNFITFNYDVSLENRLFTAINLIEHFSEEDKKNFFKSPDLLIHVYGQVRENGFENSEFGDFPDFHNFGSTMSYENIVRALDKAWEAAQAIYTIPESKRENAKPLETARRKIKEAKRVYILGYGFDENNSEVLELKNTLGWSKKDFNSISENNHRSTYFTNFGDSNRINKRAGLLFMDERDSFLNRAIPKSPAAHSINLEKSTKNVYDALSDDFDL